RRRQAFDRVDLRLLHLLQELARVGRERLDVPALPLGVDGVERQRGLAGARQPGDHDQLIARDLEVDGLEIVLAGAPDDDPITRHGGLSYASPRAAGPQPRDALRLALPHTPRLGRRGPSPATPCGSHYLIRLVYSARPPPRLAPAAIHASGAAV